MANVTDSDRQAALAVNEFDTELIADAIATAREAGEAAGREKGIREAIQIAEEWRQHHEESKAKSPRYMALYAEKEIASKCIRDEIRALLPTPTPDAQTNAEKTKAFVQSCRDMGNVLREIGITGKETPDAGRQKQTPPIFQEGE